ncbi:MAG: hypothetical protein OEU89_03110 [Burkholderiaceae bacterium]|jgi:hypothetical protein|nr:hypothetical protein [Burkholderiaceae bacterium]MDH5207521.1 hypothetical protein [Burkholderiaceae bacterium]
MAWLLDLVAVAAVVAALLFLMRPGRRSGCAACSPPAAQGAETRVSLDQLRASARRAARRS